MPSSRWNLLALIVIATATPAPTAEGQRSDGWRGPFNNGWYPAHDLPTRLDLASTLRWNTAMPSISIAEPIVMGDLVITLADPHWVIGVDLASGAIRWQTPLDVFAITGKDRRQAARDRELWDHVYALTYMQNYGDGYSWRGGDEQLGLVVDYAKLLAAARGADPDTIPSVGSLTGDLERIENKQQRANAYAPLGKRIYELAGVDDVERELAGRYGKRLATDWKTLITRVPSTPVTDGTRAYVHTSDGIIAALDAAGQVVWTFDAKPSEWRGNRTRFVPSPLLAEGMVVVAAGYHVLALDAASGKEVWRHDGDFIGRGYRCGSPVYLRAGARTGEPLYGAEQPGGVGLIATATGMVFRLEDGEVLHRELPDKTAMAGSERGGNSPVPVAADTVVFQGGNNSGGPNTCLRFVAVDGGRISAEILWSTDRPSTYSSTPAFHPPSGQMLQFKHTNSNIGYELYDAATGTTTSLVKTRSFGWPSPAIADGKVFIVRHRKAQAKSDQDEALLIDIFDFASGEQLSSQTFTIAEGLHPMRIPFIEEIGKDVLGDRWPGYSPGVSLGEQETGVHPYGNVVLLRYKGGLACWGAGAYQPPR